MSGAGVRSSQGDGYQTLVAMRSVVEMLHNEEIAEVEVDSTSLDRSGHPILVDDVVVKYRNGRCIFFQVKKNQVDSQSWAISDLAEDLRKAWLQWEREPGCGIRFVSRSPFGALGKLVDYASTQPDYPAFDHSLAKGNKKALTELVALRPSVGAPQDTLDSLRCLTFEVCDPSMLRESLRGVLGIHVAHKDVAYELLSKRVDSLARRDQAVPGGSVQAISHSFTRQELLRFLGGLCIQIGAAKSQQGLEDELHRISAIGRDWNRTIGGKPIARSAVGDILGKIVDKAPLMTLVAGPGVGKTCLLLDVLENLELTAQSFPVFLQARVFVDAASATDRASMGLPDSLCSDIARLSELRHVTIIVDSLDVLSLARAHHSLSYFLSLIDRLRVIPNVSVLAACRSFDLKYDQKLSVRQWGDSIELDELDWQSDVQPLLREWGVLDSIPTSIKSLLCNPRLLALFHDIVKTGDLPIFTTAQQLSEIYLDCVVTRNPILGDVAMQQLGKLASLMLRERKLDVPRANVGIAPDMVRQLLSIGVLIEVSGNRLSFGHQTLLDVLAVSASQHEGETLVNFIQNKAQVPFLRPTVRAFFFHLQVNDPVALRKQVRAVFDAPDIAFHIKRLVAESLAEISPVDDDWPLIRHLYQRHRPLFEWFHQRAAGLAWCQFFQRHWLPLIVAGQEGALVLRHLEQLAAHPALCNELQHLWQQLLKSNWASKSHIVWISGHLLDRFSDWQHGGLRAIFERLIDMIEDDHDALGKSLSAWVEATDANDDLLWRYIMRRTGEADKTAYDLGGKLVCSPHVFCRERFLADRMSRSSILAEAALGAVEEWSALRRSRHLDPRSWSGEFLDETSHGRVHSQHDTHHIDALNVLMNAIEQACMHGAETQSPWWKQNVQRLQRSHEGALRYFAIKAMTGFPETNASHALTTLLDEEMLEESLRWEVSLLLRAVYFNLAPDQQIAIQDLILGLYQRHAEEGGACQPWMLCAKRELLVRIPAHHRSSQAQEVLNLAERLRGTYFDAPSIRSWGGQVRPPVSFETMAGLSDEGVLRLLTYYQSTPQSTGWEEDEAGNMVGGSSQVDMQLREMASRYPKRCLRWLNTHWFVLFPSQRKQILSGAGSHLRYRFGNLSNSGWASIETPDGVDVARLLLDELAHHYEFWQSQRETADALLGCADVIDSEVDAERIAFLLVSCSMSDDPAMDREDSDSDELFVAINSTRGVAAEA